jgi:hypothetical protein
MRRRLQFKKELAELLKKYKIEEYLNMQADNLSEELLKIIEDKAKAALYK